MVQRDIGQLHGKENCHRLLKIFINHIQLRSPWIENWAYKGAYMHSLFSYFSLRHPLKTTAEYRPLVCPRLAIYMSGKMERGKRNSASYNTINSYDLNWQVVIWIRFLSIIFCQLLKRSPDLINYPLWEQWQKFQLR